jgi:hypothetical protein
VCDLPLWDFREARDLARADHSRVTSPAFSRGDA